MQFPYFLIAIYFAISTFGTVGNVLAIIGFYRIRSRPGFSTISCLFIICLAVSDLLICFVVIPMKIVVHLSEEAQTLLHRSIILCRFEPVLKASLVPFSTLMMGAVAVDRYIFLCRPISHAISQKVAFFTLGALGALSLAIGIAASFMLTLRSNASSSEVIIKLPDSDNSNSNYYFEADYDEESECQLNPNFEVAGSIIKFLQLGIVWSSVGIATTLYAIVYASVLRRRQAVWRSKRGLSSSPHSSRANRWRQFGSRQTLESSFATYFRSGTTPSTYLPSSPSVSVSRSVSMIQPAPDPGHSGGGGSSIFLSPSNNVSIRNSPSIMSNRFLTPTTSSASQNHLNVPGGGSTLTIGSISTSSKLSTKQTSVYLPTPQNQFMEKRVICPMQSNNDQQSALCLQLQVPFNNRNNGSSNHLNKQLSVCSRDLSSISGGTIMSLARPPPPFTKEAASQQFLFSANWQATYILRKNIKAAIMLFTVTLVFVLFFTPATLIIFQILPTFSEEQFELREILFNLHFASSATNPFIYVFLNSTIRKEMRRLFFKVINKVSIKRHLAHKESKRVYRERRFRAAASSRSSESGNRNNSGNQLGNNNNNNQEIPLMPSQPATNNGCNSNTIVLDTIPVLPTTMNNNKDRISLGKRFSNKIQRQSSSALPVAPTSIMISVTTPDEDDTIVTASPMPLILPPVMEINNNRPMNGDEMNRQVDDKNGNKITEDGDNDVPLINNIVPTVIIGDDDGELAIFKLKEHIKNKCLRDDDDDNMEERINETPV